ncbi:hypothetical protein LOTGIDRAFT_187198 [Lottia gigantea]|uniref:Major facilitator superfamily (MFS) profile domain-containing protein n=1 Tax=Lottia gigantea TaxID=225164 RepID=V4CAV6_LOTGI|nr:hypothetical protein LOTGIDRAFT_187198 [Lottia gigantea]ESO98954.1 hypothetical protein LOTGIDRAFT_187198 [Lottia gigantea]
MDKKREENQPSFNNEVEMKKTNDNAENTPNDDFDDGLPIDRGWAWVIAIATQFNQMLKVGYARAMGLLFIEFLKVFKASATETTLISGVKAGVFGLSVFISMQILVVRLPIRFIVALGGTLSAIGIMSCAFATEIQQVVILQAIFIGIDNSMIHGPGLVLVGQYFKKKRGLGTAISNSGVSAGAVIVPPIVKLLLDHYGLDGTLLIIGAIELNVLVFACLMRPLDSFKRKPKPKHVNNDNIITKNRNPCKSLDFTVWKQPHFLMMAFNAFCGNCTVLFLAYYPAHVVEKGASENDSALFLSIAGGIDFFARLLAGYIADRGCFRRTHICVFSLFMTALNCHCIRFYDSYGLQLLGTIVYGIFGGIFNSFTALLLMDFLGSDNLARSLGFIMILNGVAVSIYHPTVGALRDYTGSFIPAYHFMGTMLSLAALMLLLEPFIARCAKRLQNRTDGAE